MPQMVGVPPPSMTHSAPWIEAARLEARNAINSATSSGSAGRPNGIPPSALRMLSFAAFRSPRRNPTATFKAFVDFARRQCAASGASRVPRAETRWPGHLADRRTSGAWRTAVLKAGLMFWSPPRPRVFSLVQPTGASGRDSPGSRKANSEPVRGRPLVLEANKLCRKPSHARGRAAVACGGEPCARLSPLRSSPLRFW